MPPKILACVLLAVGGALLVATGLVAWGGVNRYLAAGALVEARDKAFAGDYAGARAAARSALDLLPGEPAALLAAADLTSANDAEALTAAMYRATPAGRTALAAAVGLATGKPADGANTSDTALLQAIASKSPGAPRLDHDQPPHQAVLGAWAVSRLAAAFASHSGGDAQSAASTILLLAPRHPQAAELNLLAVALAPESTVGKIIEAAGPISDINRRNRLGLHLVAMAPQRSELRALLPGGGDAGTVENAALDKLVTSARGRPDTIHEGLVIRCLQAGKPDLADALVAAAQPAARQKELGLFGDLLDGGAFGAVAPPQVTQPTVVGGNLSFHLTNALGAIPTKRIGVRIGALEVPPDSMRRLGTLISMPVRIDATQTVTVSYDGKAVFATNLSQ